MMSKQTSRAIKLIQTKLIRTKLIKTLLISIACLFSFSSQATIVQVETNLGNFEINLYDNDTPLTVANFLNYVNNSDYSAAVFHRAEPNFVLQGGGFTFDQAWPLNAITANAAVNNEPVYSNVRGTIAMAKLSSNVNSATNQWFISVGNNSANLDAQNGGFTVFGQVVGDGMTIVDSIMNVQRYNLGGAFTSIPLQGYDPANDPTESNLIIISSIQIIDATVNTTSGLTRPLNPGPPVTPEPTSSSGGGALGVWFILLLGIFFQRSFVIRASSKNMI